MAAVSTSPPPTSTSPSSIDHRDSVNMQSMSPVSRKPLPLSNAPVSEAPKMRETPASPVQVNFHHENWAQPSNANIENAQLNATKADPADSPLGNQSLRALESSPVPVVGISSRAGLSAQDSSYEAQALHDNSVDGNVIGSHSAIKDNSSSSIANPQERVRRQDMHRNSRESDETNASQQPTSVKSSATTSASSLSGINENSECPVEGDSPGSSVIEGNPLRDASIPQFQYHHQQEHPPRVSSVPGEGIRSPSNPDLLDSAGNIRRHLTPGSNHFRRSSLPRPQSSYSVFSERGRSPNLAAGGSNLRDPSVSRRSPDVRLSSYAELLNVPYPQQAPAPINLDNSLLRNAVGNNASLLSAQKTLEMYRQNVKKTSDFSIQYSFAVFLISIAQEQGFDFTEPKSKKSAAQPVKDIDGEIIEASVTNPIELIREARGLLQRLASGGYPFAQYYLADGFASGLFNKGKEDYNSAFPLFVLAAKHGHAESAYRTALCYEFGWGCRKDPAKAVQFLRTAASKRHPGAMTRLGKACLSGDLGEKRYREGIKWMKLATEAADAQYNAAPYQLGCLYETGYGDDIFRDLSYAAELFTQAADLGHPEANYRMGDAYEHGLLSCPRDPALSVHFYTGAAERGHAAAMMGLCAWYMVGAPPMLEKDEEEAYEWAHRSAELNFVKAQYAVGYFTEMGIGCRRDILEANVWYVKAADAGDERAKQRLSVIQAAVTGQGTPMEVAPPRGGKISKGAKDDKECVVM